MWFKHCKLLVALIAYFTFGSSVDAFDDPISLLGRIRWNYTSYEENLWTRTYKNTTLQQIYLDHNEYIELINKVYDAKDDFYPTLANASSNSLKNAVIVDAFLNNPNSVPVVSSVVLSNAQVAEYWSKFSNWTSFNSSNMLDVLTDDAIPTLQTSLDTFWNATNTVIYFDFLKNVRFISVNRKIIISKLTLAPAKKVPFSYQRPKYEANGFRLIFVSHSFSTEISSVHQHGPISVACLQTH